MNQFILVLFGCLAAQLAVAQPLPRFQLDALAGAVDALIEPSIHEEEGFTEFQMSPAFQLQASWRLSNRLSLGVHQAYTSFHKTYNYHPGLQETFFGSRYVLQGTLSFFYTTREKHQLYSTLRIGQHWNLGKKDPGSTLFKGGTSRFNSQIVLLGYRIMLWRKLGFLTEIAIGAPTAINAGISLAIP